MNLPKKLGIGNQAFTLALHCQLAILHTVALQNLPMFYSIPLSVWHEIVFHARQTCKQQQTHSQKQNLSETITPIDKRCEMLINL